MSIDRFQNEKGKALSENYESVRELILSDAPDHDKEAYYMSIFMRLEGRISEGILDKHALDKGIAMINAVMAHIDFNNGFYITVLKRYIEMLDGKCKNTEALDPDTAVKFALQIAMAQVR